MSHSHYPTDTAMYEAVLSEASRDIRLLLAERYALRAENLALKRIIAER